MSGWWWRMRQISRKLWVRTTLIGLMGLAAAVVAAMVEHLIPWDMPSFVPVSAIESLLTIIASSMLAVSTFSLNIMTGAYSAASNSVTPRATKLLMEDTMTQTVLASFVGSFIFSIVGMVLLRFGVYGERGRVVLFIVTIWVIALIVINLLRWINYLTHFGRMGETISRVEKVTHHALQERLHAPYLGGMEWTVGSQPPAHGVVVCSGKVGCLQHIDMPGLQAVAQSIGGQVYVPCLPGKILYVDSPLAWLVSGPQAPSPELLAQAQHIARQAFTVEVERNFDQDPRFGLAVLCEIASRALSPATNDPGTALDVIARMTRLLSMWGQGRADADFAQQPPSYPDVWVPALQHADLFDDAYMLMARDGAGLIEVQLALQKSLAALARLGEREFREAAQAQATLAMARAEQAMVLEADKTRLRAVVNGLQQSLRCP